MEWTNAAVGKQQRVSGVVWREVCRETPTARCSSVNFGEKRIEYQHREGAMNLTTSDHYTIAPMVWAVLPRVRRSAAGWRAGAVPSGRDTQQPRFSSRWQRI